MEARRVFHNASIEWRKIKSSRDSWYVCVSFDNRLEASYDYRSS